MKNGKPTVCVHRPADRAVRRALRRPCRRERRRPHTARQRRRPTSTAGRWTASSARPSRAGRAASNPTDPACTNSATPDVMGYHTAERHPELLDLRQGLRPPGPHVRAERLVEPARAPVPGVGVVGVLHPARQPVELRQRTADQAAASARQHRPSTAARPAQERTKQAASTQNRPADLRLDRPDLPAPQGPRQLGLLRGERHRARLRERRRRDLRARSRRTPTRPASGTRCRGSTRCKADHQLGNIQDVDNFYARGQERAPCRRCRGSCPPARSASTRRRRSATGRPTSPA